MPSFVERALTSLAFCWRLERRDGVCLGFTGHDRDLVVGGLTYRAVPGLLPSAISVSDGFEASALDVSGALTSDSISAADLEAGRWDRAGVALFLVDWQDPDGERLALVRGELGDVGVRGNAFEAELRGPAALLEPPVVEQTSPECRAELGDRRCRVDMSGRTLLTRVVASPAANVVTVAEAASAAGAYAFGRLRWIGGANSGLESSIADSEGDRLILREPPPFAVAAGDTVEIREGCDKSVRDLPGALRQCREFPGRAAPAGNGPAHPLSRGLSAMKGEAIVARARALIGVRFRLQGRDPGHGLDCIGVVMMATRTAKTRARRDYGLHRCDPEELNAGLDEAGFVRIAPAAAADGDVLVVRPGPTGLHVVILTDRGYLHADARLRRVVEVPGEVPWPILSAWRHPEEAAEDPIAPALSGPSTRLH